MKRPSFPLLIFSVPAMIAIIFSCLCCCSLLHYAAQAQTASKTTQHSAPRMLWSFQTSAPFFASPFVENGTVYIGSLDSTFYAISIHTGKLLWKFKTGGEIRSTACSDSNTLYFFSGDGCVYAINKTEHTLRWKFASRGDRKYELFSFADYYQSSPFLYNDTLYVGSGDGSVYALNTHNGKAIWEYKTNSVVHSSPVRYHNSIYVGSFDGYFYALDALNGTLQWKFKSVGQRYFPNGEMQGSPFAFDGMIFCGSRDYNFYAINAEKGHALWNKQFARGWSMATPLVYDSVLYIGTSDDRLVLALNPYYGNVLWQTNVKFNVFASFAVRDNHLYVATLMGRVYALEKNTGEILWSINNELYEKNRSKYLKEDESYRDDIGSIIQRNEDVLAMYYNFGAIFSTPAISGTSLLIASTDGSIRCYDLRR